MELNLFDRTADRAGDNLYAACRQFFTEQCGIPLKTIQEAQVAYPYIGISAKDDIKDLLAAYAIGLVDDEAFGGEQRDPDALARLRDGQGDYPGIVVLALELKPGDYARGHLARLTRAVNRHFKHTPVMVVFRYGHRISLASSERLRYQQQWREGEKVGKISLLKDIDVQQPHRGHLNILQNLRIPSSGPRAVRDFTQLYFYWRSVLSISMLNKEFYGHVIGWFNKAVKEIKLPGHKAGSEKHKDFSVRLIARLIFLWFLKELRVVEESLLLPAFENGAENDLIKPQRKGSGYYKFVLQNLFFQALNSEKGQRKKKLFDVYADAFADPERLKELIFKSPYLNGGLFDIHDNDWKPEQVNNGFVVPDHLFLDLEEGINAILARYKFTIAENTPLEEEIAVDPEMLGRIFENLLAEQTEDTQEAARKSKGAFYTPRPVVSYMCRNVLHKHLGMELSPKNGRKVVEKLLATTVLDPACGSGAYPMGMLEEMMHVLETVDPEGNLWVAEMKKSGDEAFKEHIADFVADKQIGYVKKLGLLRNCLFGIDILEYAVEITKLRCWLSLIVEQRVDLNKPNYNLKPLPNLEFKFYKKNSLLRKYEERNLNDLARDMDSDKLLQELVDLENQFFITRSDMLGTKERIKAKIIKLLEKLVDTQITKLAKEEKQARELVNRLVGSKAEKREVDKYRKQQQKLAGKLGELAKLREEIKDYFIESVTFPGICNSRSRNPGFDIVIGNPPYVNTKQIKKQGLTEKLKQEYGYCDDLYNHFTVRGLELLKRGGHLSYITSDTFLTLQTKENMRRLFLGLPPESVASTSGNGQANLLDQLDAAAECHLQEVINTPKAFAALVDTAIFTIQRKELGVDAQVTYVDLRFPKAETFGITEEEWRLTTASKENQSGWERVLEKTFAELGISTQEDWQPRHTCDGRPVLRDRGSGLQKYRLSPQVYREAIGLAIFAPSPYNCQLLDRVVKPARAVFDQWWDRIETSRAIESNERDLARHRNSLATGAWSLIGLLTTGGVGLQTGDNGRFVGYRKNTSEADVCVQNRARKLAQLVSTKPGLRHTFPALRAVEDNASALELLDSMKEQEVWDLFDGIKAREGLRAFGKGFLFRIVPESLQFDVAGITPAQKEKGIKAKRCWVPYDKGDRGGNRWYSETPYVIDWSQEAVTWLTEHSGRSGAGMPVVRNPQFYFRTGFCWSDVLNPNSSYIKCRLKGNTVNDVKSMSLYDESGLGDEFLVVLINSYLGFKTLREFMNNTVAIQMNDIRKLPVKVPSKDELAHFRKLFKACLAVKQAQFAGKLTKEEAKAKLIPLEQEVDRAVSKFYRITAEAEVLESEEELLDVVEEDDGDEDE